MNAQLKILAVDDSGLMMMILIAALNALGYTNIICAEDGEEAYQKLVATRDFDLVITDFRMPKMDGVDLTKAIRSDATLKSLPIIMLSSEDQQSAALAVAVGVNIFLPKPLERDVLAQAIGKLCP